MGMFDHIHCTYPLPIDEEIAGGFQTKDTPALNLDDYEIRADGTLWHQEYDIEDQSDPGAEGLESIAGRLARVNVRWVHCADFTGEIAFYRFADEDAATGWIEFSATFHNGRLQELNLVENRAS